MGEIEYAIINLMNERKISQAELSRRSGVSRSSLSRYLSGDDIPASKLRKIADVLGVSVDNILGTEHLRRLPLSVDEYEILSIYEGLDEHGKSVLLATARALAGTR